MKKFLKLIGLIMIPLCAEAREQFAPDTPFETVAKKLRSISLDPHHSRFELLKSVGDSDKQITLSLSGFGTSEEMTSGNRPSLVCRFETRSTYASVNPLPASVVDQMFTRMNGDPIELSDWYDMGNNWYSIDAVAIKPGVEFLVAGPAIFTDYGAYASCAKWQEPTYQYGDEEQACVEDGPTLGSWSDLKLPLQVKLAGGVTLNNVYFICTSYRGGEISLDDVLHAPRQTFHLDF